MISAGSPGDNMPTHEHTSSTADSSHTGTLLFVTNPANDSQPVLEFACALAQKHRARLELVHVVDPGHISSMPDAQMGIQYKLEALARNLRSLSRSAQAILLFGKPEHVLRERAEEIKAILIAIALNGSATDRVQKRLAGYLARKCHCPVLTVPPDIYAGDRQALSIPSHPARRLVS
jgi:nucleotide-binding universal stress UspA family protein